MICIAWQSLNQPVPFVDAFEIELSVIEFWIQKSFNNFY